MGAEARNQYLRDLREEYCLAPKSTKNRLLDEAAKRTGLACKVIIRKLAHPATLVRRPPGKRRRTYDAAVCAAWSYHRLSGELPYRLLKDLYRVWGLWRNYSQPVMRLEANTRTGAKVHQCYDFPATPYQRLLASSQLSAMARQSLEQRYASLNPVLLRKQIEQRQKELLRTIHRNATAPVSLWKLSPRSVTSFVTRRVAVRLPVRMT